MAYVAVPGAMFIPEPRWLSGIPAQSSAILLDAAADRVAWVFRAAKTGTAKKLELRFGTVPALNAASNLTIGIQPVDATTGDPTGTFTDSVTIANGSITANTTFQATLATGVSVTIGTLYAVVVQFNTFNSGDQVNIRPGMTEGTRDGGIYSGYLTTNTTGSYAKVSATLPSVSIEYSDATYAFMPECWPVVVPSSVAFANSSTPDAIGLRWQLPFPHKINGAWVNIDADGDFDLILYDASTKTTVASVDKDNRALTTVNTGLITFSSEQTCAASTTYVLAVEPSSATNVTLSYVDVAAASRLDQLNGGQAFHYATAKNPATTADFAMTTTRRPVMGILVSAVDNGVSASNVNLLHGKLG